MRLSLLLALLVVTPALPVAAVAANHAATAGETALFDGTSLTGWVVENGGHFSVVDGVIRVDRGTGWLRSAGTFADFTVTLEFRFLEAEANSGIFVRTAATSNTDANGWPNNGYQVQCMDTITGTRPLATMIPYGAPEFKHESDLEALKRAYRPVGEWQTMVITCIGETMKVTLNGTRITTCTEIKNRTGHIGIQGEHGLLEFRKIAVVRR